MAESRGREASPPPASPLVLSHFSWTSLLLSPSSVSTLSHPLACYLLPSSLTSSCLYPAQCRLHFPHTSSITSCFLTCHNQSPLFFSPHTSYPPCFCLSGLWAFRPGSHVEMKNLLKHNKADTVRRCDFSKQTWGPSKDALLAHILTCSSSTSCCVICVRTSVYAYLQLDICFNKCFCKKRKGIFTVYTMCPCSEQGSEGVLPWQPYAPAAPRSENAKP